MVLHTLNRFFNGNTSYSVIFQNVFNQLLKKLLEAYIKDFFLFKFSYDL